MTDAKTAEQVEALERHERRWRMRAMDLSDALAGAERMLAVGISKADVADYIRSRLNFWAKQEMP